MDVNCLFVQCYNHLFRTIELQAFALGSVTKFGDVVKSEHHILGRHGDRCSVCRVQDVVRTEHKELCLHNGCISKRKVNRHLVTVEVGVERSTSERMQLDSLTLNHLRLECLNTESVKCRRTVQKHRMALHHILEDFPYHRVLAVHNLLCRLHCLHDSPLNQFPDNERLVKLSCHKLRQTALVHLELRTHDDN